MIQRAQREPGLDLSSSALVGDMDSDVETGLRAGVAHCLKLGAENFVHRSAMTHAMAWLRSIGQGHKEPGPLDATQIRTWFHKPRTSKLARDRVMELYFTFHPRTALLKTLPRGSSVVDIGAGDGSLSVFLGWPAPERKDLSLHAYSIEKGAMFDQFRSYETSDWNVAPPEFGGLVFDAVACAHFIEHIADPSSFVAWAPRKLTVGGRIYLEWPSPASLDLPSRTHVDCDICEGVKYAVIASRPHMVPDGYFAFDDPLHGSCLGAMQAIKETLLHQDRLFAEQMYPHPVYRYPEIA